METIQQEIDLDYANIVTEYGTETGTGNGQRPPKKPGNGRLAILQQRKNRLRKFAFKDRNVRSQFFRCVREISKLKKEVSREQLKSDFHGVSKCVVSHSSVDAAPSVPVECKKVAVYEHFYSTYELIPPIEIPDDVIHDHVIKTPFENGPISDSEFQLALNAANSKSVGGEDGITYKGIKNFKHIWPRILLLLNTILTFATPPTSWSRGLITLIFKKGDKGKPANYRPICVTSCLGKLFNGIIARRLERYVLRNGMIDAEIQKGFVRGEKGTLTHPFMIHEVVGQAIHRKSKVYITSLDLKDAFGSVPHNLIKSTLESLRLPSNITNYLLNFYSKLSARVKAKDGKTRVFNFKKGVGQGCTISPLIFILCLESVIRAFLPSAKKHAFKMADGTEICFFAFADDTILISDDEEEHQKLLNEFNKICNSVKLTIRPDKCVSLKVENGVIGPLNTTIDGVPTKPLSRDPEKYLGSVLVTNHIFGPAKYLLRKIKKGLQNIERTKGLKGRDKLKIMLNYFLPSQQHALTANEMPAVVLREMDEVVHRYVKKWTELDPGYEDMTSLQPLVFPSELYQIVQTQAFIHRLYSDNAVMSAVFQKHERENNIFIEAALDYLSATKDIRSALRKAKRDILKNIPDHGLNKIRQNVDEAEIELNNEYPDDE